MNNPTVIFDPYAAADLRNIVQTIVDNYNVARTGQAEWYPVAFFLKDENGEALRRSRPSLSALTACVSWSFFYAWIIAMLLYREKMVPNLVIWRVERIGC